jgi:hypothetical protein
MLYGEIGRIKMGQICSMYVDESLNDICMEYSQWNCPAEYHFGEKKRHWKLHRTLTVGSRNPSIKHASKSCGVSLESSSPTFVNFLFWGSSTDLCVVRRTVVPNIKMLPPLLDVPGIHRILWPRSVLVCYKFLRFPMFLSRWKWRIVIFLTSDYMTESPMCRSKM